MLDIKARETYFLLVLKSVSIPPRGSDLWTYIFESHVRREACNALLHGLIISVLDFGLDPTRFFINMIRV